MFESILEKLIDSVKDATIDTLKLIPFLFITYLIMEALERKTSDASAKKLTDVGRFGPILGGIIGIIPQCGFSAAASSLYAGGLISIGTLISVFLSTSDEMLPLFISEHLALPTILKILLSKALIAVFSGFMVDTLLSFTRFKYKTRQRISELCEEEHGDDTEDKGVFIDALRHTIHITIFIYIISIILTLLVESLGSDVIRSFLTNRLIIGVLLTALIGLIPNCASSIIITQLFLDGMITTGQLMSGLMVNAGVGLLVLFRTNNHHPRENFKILCMLYLIGIFWGFFFEIFNINF